MVYLYGFEVKLIDQKQHTNPNAMARDNVHDLGFRSISSMDHQCSFGEKK
jgi:hypothetical protein